MQEYVTTKELDSRVLEINKVLQEILDILGRNRLVIEFDSMGGSHVDPVTAYRGQSIGILPIPYKEGYDFDGWYLSIFKKASYVSSIELQGVPVYRFFSRVNGDHFFTISEEEKENLIASESDYVYEGIVFYAEAIAEPGAHPVYRFYSSVNGVHFFTLSIEEKNFLIANDLTWKYEGIAFYAYPGNYYPNLVPVYRFVLNAVVSGSSIVYHMYTSNLLEVDSLYDSGWTYEGIAFYLFPASNNTVLTEEYEYSNKLENLSLNNLTGRIKVYAKWNLAMIPINLDPVGGTVNPETIKVRYLGKFGDAVQGPDMPIGLPIPVREGSSFKTWYYSQNERNFSVDDETILMVLHTMNLSALWDANSFTLHFDSNGASGKIPDKKSTVGSSITMPTSQETLSALFYIGKSFLGWSTTKLARDIKNELVLTKDTTVYAIWDNRRYGINYYDLNGNFSISTSTYMNVPNYLVEVGDLSGKYFGFDHWNSIPGTYADYLKMQDGELFYNLTMNPDTVVSLFADSNPVPSILLSLNVILNTGNLSIGQNMHFGENEGASAYFEDKENSSRKTWVNVTDATRIYPFTIDENTVSLYVSFKYDGNEVRWSSKEIFPDDSIKSIRIVTPPIKTNYYEGDSLDLQGLTFEVISSDDSKLLITDYTNPNYFYPKNGDYLNYSNSLVQIGYPKFNSPFYVFQSIVVNEREEISEIFVAKKPKTRIYKAGERFDSTGYEIDGYFKNSEESDILFTKNVTSKCTFLPEIFQNPSDKIISVFYNYDPNAESMISTTFEVPLDGLFYSVLNTSIRRPANKTVYSPGEQFDPKGLLIDIEYTDRSLLLSVDPTSSDIPFRFEPATNLQIGMDSVKIIPDPNRNPDNKFCIQPIAVSYDTNNFMLIDILRPAEETGDIVLKAQYNNGINKIVKYPSSLQNIDYNYLISINDSTDLTLTNINFESQPSIQITCYYSDPPLDAENSFNFSESLFDVDHRECLKSLNFSNLNNISVLNPFSENLLYGCSHLESIVFPIVPFHLGNNFLKNLTALTSVTNTEYATQDMFYVAFGEGAFMGCTSLQSIVLPTIDRLNYWNIPNNLFYGCSNLTSIVNLNKNLNNITSIGANAFREINFGLTLEIPVSKVSFGENAFYGSLFKLKISGIDLQNLSDYPNFPWGLNPETDITCINDVNS